MPLIGIVGPSCAGKKTIAGYLCDRCGYRRVSLQGRSELSFCSVEELVGHVTRCWRERFVIVDIPSRHEVETLAKRPFFLLVCVDAPVMVRWARQQARAADEISGRPCSADSLEQFIEASDRSWYFGAHSLAHLALAARIRVLNHYRCTDDLVEFLRSADIANESLLRPSWDEYFMQLASLAAQRSNCMKRRVGCVLVRDHRIVATGYNGTPRGTLNCNDGGCPRCNQAQGSGHGLTTCLCLHAEENALLEAGRDRVGSGAVLYCNTCPCLTCSVKIVQVGVQEVVYSVSYSMDEASADVLRRGHVILRQYESPPRTNF